MKIWEAFAVEICSSFSDAVQQCRALQLDSVQNAGMRQRLGSAQPSHTAMTERRDARFIECMWCLAYWSLAPSFCLTWPCSPLIWLASHGLHLSRQPKADFISFLALDHLCSAASVRSTYECFLDSWILYFWMYQRKKWNPVTWKYEHRFPQACCQEAESRSHLKAVVIRICICQWPEQMLLAKDDVRNSSGAFSTDFSIQIWSVAAMFVFLSWAQSPRVKDPSSIWRWPMIRCLSSMMICQIRFSLLWFEGSIMHDITCRMWIFEIQKKVEAKTRND